MVKQAGNWLAGSVLIMAGACIETLHCVQAHTMFLQDCKGSFVDWLVEDKQRKWSNGFAGVAEELGWVPLR
jgi:hypothetical protein